MNRRPLCPCGWGQGIVNASAVVLLARECAADLAWRDRMWTLAALMVDTSTP